jgi:fatty acid desaturase
MKFVNEAGWDRIVRVVLGIALLYLGWAGVVTGGWGVFLKVIGFVPLLTGLVGFCPLYAIFRIRTNKTAA